MNLPKNSKVDKFLPKSKFYEKVFINNKLKEEFTDLVKKITWKYKLSEETIGISKTKEIEEIQIFELELKEKRIPDKILKLIDRSIPYPILFIVVFENDRLYAVSLKEKGKQDSYYYSKWNEEIEFDFTGVNLKKVYQKIIKKFIKNTDLTEDFAQVVEKDAKIKSLEKEIAMLEGKMKKEKQFNKKVAFNQEINNKRKELSKIKNN